MNYNIRTIPPFDKQFKKLSKKYPSLRAELLNLIAELRIDPRKGISLGNDCFKIRISITSKGKGKSGGARVITYLANADSIIFLLSVYDKSQHTDISDKELLRLIEISKQ